MDRRIIRTKDALWNALVDLILERGYARVRVQDILDRANIGRSTFYSHFESKEHLLFSGQVHLSNSLTIGEGLDFSPLLAHAEAHARLARALLISEDQHLVRDHLHQSIEDQLAEVYTEHLQKGDESEYWQIQLLLTTAAGAIVVLFVSWIQEDMRYPISWMNEQMKRIVKGIVGEVEELRS